MRFIDLHQDLRLSIERPELLDEGHRKNPQTGFAKLKNNQVAVVLCTGFPVPDDGDIYAKRNFTDLFDDARWYQAQAATDPDWLIVRTADDLTECLAGRRHGIIFHLEGINMFDGHPEDWEHLSALYEYGLRSVALTWNKRNALCGGNDDPGQGITPVGHKLIEWCLQHNMIIDLAHISRAGFFDYQRTHGGPLLVSHGAADAIRADPRNYDDEQLRLIGESSGCFGVFFSKRFACPNETCGLEQVVQQIEHVRNVAGIDAVALGSDFGGVVSGTPDGLSSLNDLSVLLDRLRKNGWSDDECEKFAYKNAERVLNVYLTA